MIRLSEGITTENLANLYLDPLMARTGDDNQRVYPVFHPLATYVSAFVAGEFVGAYLVIRYTDTEYEVHSLLMKSAIGASRELGRLILRWVFANPGVMRVTGHVREGLESNRNHCLKMGMRLEGFRRDAVRVNGEPKGIYVMGITRKEWSKS